MKITSPLYELANLVLLQLKVREASDPKGNLWKRRVASAVIGTLVVIAEYCKMDEEALDLRKAQGVLSAGLMPENLPPTIGPEA